MPPRLGTAGVKTRPPLSTNGPKRQCMQRTDRRECEARTAARFTGGDDEERKPRGQLQAQNACGRERAIAKPD
jgi:hypothetical protein